MTKTLLRRLLIIPVLLIVVHYVGYAFAHITFQLQQMQTVYGSGKEGITPVWPEYTAYVRSALQGDLGSLPVGLDEPLAYALWEASISSLGLVLLVLLLALFGPYLAPQDPMKTSYVAEYQDRFIRPPWRGRVSNRLG